MTQKFKKRILIIGSKEKFSLENMYVRALRSKGNKVVSYHTYDIRKNIFFRFLWKYFKSLIFIYIRIILLIFLKSKKHKFDLIIIFKGLFLNKNIFLKMKKIHKKAKWINIFPDDPFDTNEFKDISNKNVLKTINFYDIFFIYSHKILKKLKKKYPSKIFFYLPFGFDSFHHKNRNIFKKKTYDLSFIGTADQKRYDYLKKLNEFKIVLAGDGWKNFNLNKNIEYLGNADVKKFSEMINSSEISLNILRKQNEHSHNMKTFEIPAMGGVLLTKRSYEQNQFFPENKASLMYNNIGELKQKIYFAKKNPKKISKIKENIKNFINKHSYHERSLFILKKVFYEK